MTKAEQLQWNKPKKRRKKSERTKLKKNLETLVKTFVKERDQYICQHCGKKLEKRNCHASHVYSVGSTPSLQFEPLNMKTLCYFCHFNWWHKNPFEASEWFRVTFPDRLEYLEAKRYEVVEMSEDWLKEEIQKYKLLLKQV